MRLQLTDELLTSIRSIQEKSREGSAWHRRQLELIAAGLEAVRGLPAEPIEENAEFKRVRQSKRNQVWRWAHSYEEGIAVRLILWFTPEGDVVVALFVGEKARIGDVWYDSVGSRADTLIELWKWRREGRARMEGEE